MALLADFISVVHFAYVAYVVVGQLLILIGIIARWTWVRNFWFRITHLAAISIVAIEAAWGITCPLTTWEHQLRRASGQSVAARSFVAQIMHDLMFFELPEWTLRSLHIAFAALVIGTFLLAPPRRTPKTPQPEASASS